jgi:CheY-like chemotaxis protein
MKPSPHVLIVDDNQDVLNMLEHSLSRHGFRIDAMRTPQDALLRLETEQYDAALLDLVMPGSDGLALAEALRERSPGLPVALLTGYERSPLLRVAKKSGVAVFTKPVAIHVLVEYLTEVIGG